MIVVLDGELIGRTVVPSERAGRQTVLFRAQTALTKPELLYALETTLTFNDLAVIEVDGKTIRAGYINEQDLAKKKTH